MKSTFLNIEEIKILPASTLHEGIQDLEIVNLANAVEPEYFTPGTAFYNMEEKPTAAGNAYSHSAEYSVPGLLTPAQDSKIKNAGALLIKLKGSDNRKILYRNDYYSNAKLLGQVSTTLDKTMIKFAITTIAYD